MHEMSTSSLRGTWFPDAILGLRKFLAVVCIITWTIKNTLYFHSQYLHTNIRSCKIKYTVTYQVQSIPTSKNIDAHFLNFKLYHTHNTHKADPKTARRELLGSVKI